MMYSLNVEILQINTSASRNRGKYLEFIGWGFTDIDEQGQTVDFEQLLYNG